MTLTKHVVENIIRKLLQGKDYRVEIITLINAEFLQFAIKFFRKVAGQETLALQPRPPIAR